MCYIQWCYIQLIWQYVQLIKQNFIIYNIFGNGLLHCISPNCLNILHRSYPGDCNIKLSMCKDWRVKVQAYILHWLPFRFVDCHGKQRWTGNCQQINLKGTWSSEGDRLIHGIKIISPAWSPVRSQTSNTQFLHWVTIPLLPLQTPFAGLRFLRIMTGQPGLRASAASGRPEQLMELRYSTG